MSNAQLTISFHTSLSFANLERVCISFWHHSRISSSHSLFGLPLFPLPSIDPSITLFIFRSFSILHICPNRLSFLLITTCHYIKGILRQKLKYTYKLKTS